MSKLKGIIGKHWNTLNIIPDYRETFNIAPIIALQKKLFETSDNIIGDNKDILSWQASSLKESARQVTVQASYIVN